MNETQAVQLFKCLADTTRLQLLSALSDGPKYVELLSQLLDRSPSTVSFHLKKLEETGLVEAKKEQYYTMYSLNRALLDQPVSQLALGDRQQLDAQALKEQQYRENVLKNLFEYGKLKTIPVQRKKRRIVLEKLAESFEAGVRYPEKQVNLILADFHDDFCTLRREMIAEGIMARDKGEYWLREEAADAGQGEA
ncbi:MAG: metalloregulator ArsR/SmtB family transcription factor [Clostridia bacterium]|nr:metalloregulator ArsR/SmtB family transcription factor [Clostridia bacterium]